jgi:DNA-directed RNA polymerase sigma subunit (sigma70/sigma32)
LRRDDEGGLLLEDVIPDERAEFESRVLDRLEAERLLGRCSEKERRVIEAVGAGLTYSVIGRLEGNVSRQRIEQIRKKAMRKIKRAIVR